MPIEIRELEIQVSVNNPGTGTPSPSEEPDNAAPGASKKIIAECIEQVMRIINEKKER